MRVEMVQIDGEAVPLSRSDAYVQVNSSTASQRRSMTRARDGTAIGRGDEVPQ